MISGATGAMAVVVVSLVAMHGVEYLFPTVILCGVLQIAIGLGRLGKLIRMVPHSVMLGFVNGLAIVIGLAQLGSFKTLSADGALVFLAGPKLNYDCGSCVAICDRDRDPTCDRREHIGFQLCSGPGCGESNCDRWRYVAYQRNSCSDRGQLTFAFIGNRTRGFA